MAKLTVLVSVYNSGEWLENRLNNLLRSDMGSNLEIYCLNAASPDQRDDDICQKFRHQIIYEKLPERIGIYAAWNHMIKNSSGEYLTNGNTDDLVAPNCYSKLIAAIENDKDYGFAYPSWISSDVANQSWPPQNGDMSGGGHPGHYCGDIDRGGVGHFPLWRRSLHDQFGLFDETFPSLGDCDWWARCYFIGNVKFMWVREFLALYLFRHGQNSWHRTISAAEWERYSEKVTIYKTGVNPHVTQHQSPTILHM